MVARCEYAHLTNGPSIIIEQMIGSLEINFNVIRDKSSIFAVSKLF
jgi:hypothetical protein